MFFKDNLSKLIAQLPENYQIVLSLYYCERLTFKEMAAVLDVTPQEACNLYSSAHNRLLAMRLNDSHLSNS